MFLRTENNDSHMFFFGFLFFATFSAQSRSEVVSFFFVVVPSLFFFFLFLSFVPRSVQHASARHVTLHYGKLATTPS